MSPEAGPLQTLVTSSNPVPARIPFRRPPAVSGPGPPRARSRRAAAPSGRSMAARVASLFVDLDADRRNPSVDRVLNGPSRPDDPSWRRRVKVAAGGQGSGPRDRATMDRDRARMPLPGPRRIAVLGCTSGAGQSVIAMMTGHTLAALRDVPVAALDLNPGDTSLAARIEPATSVTALLAGQGPDPQAAAGAGRARPGGGGARGRVDVIAGPPGTSGTRPLGAGDYERLGRLLDERYPLTLIDPAPAGLTRVLSLADQLVLVTPASPEAAARWPTPSSGWARTGSTSSPPAPSRWSTGSAAAAWTMCAGPSRWPGAAAGPSSGCRGTARCRRSGFARRAAPADQAGLHRAGRRVVSGLAARAPELGNPPAAAPSPTHVREKESW